MRCRYKYCRNNNEVDKEKAVKDKGSYYCLECFKEKTTKQEIEKYYIENLPQTTIILLRKVINQLIHDNNYEAEYVLFIVKKVYVNGLKINNPFGLTYYCNEGRNIAEWKSKKTNIEYQNIKDEVVKSSDDNKVQFTYKPNNKKWTDLV